MQYLEIEQAIKLLKNNKKTLNKIKSQKKVVKNG